MTIGIWVLLIIIVLVGGGIAASLFYAAHEEESTGFLIGAIAVIILTVAGSALIVWYRSSSATGQRALKDQQSDLSGGITRTVTVYDINGKEIKQYSGKFDIETGNKDGASYFLFDDENGKRHIVYYSTGTVIIDEK